MIYIIDHKDSFTFNVVINNSIFNYLKKLKLDNVYISRRKRRASVLSKGLEIYKNLENS